MDLDRAGADLQIIGDRLVRQAGDQAIEDLALARRQSCRALLGSRQSPRRGAASMAWRSSAGRIADSSASSSNGFSRKSTAPAFIASTASGTSPWPVMTMTGNADAPRLQLPLQLEAIDPRHPTSVMMQPGCIVAAARRGRRRRIRGPARRSPRLSAGRPAACRTASSSSIRCTTASGAIAQLLRCLTALSVKRKIVPPPGLGSTQSRPPCASMMVREIDRPMPMPSGLVVTKG